MDELPSDKIQKKRLASLKDKFTPGLQPMSCHYSLFTAVGRLSELCLILEKVEKVAKKDAMWPGEEHRNQSGSNSRLGNNWGKIGRKTPILIRLMEHQLYVCQQFGSLEPRAISIVPRELQPPNISEQQSGKDSI